MIPSFNNFATTHPGAIAQSSFTPEEVQRIKINSEMASLKIAIQYAGGDPLSNAITLWHNSFSEAIDIRNGDLNRTIEIFIGLSQKLLRSPIHPYYPFDREVFLGSDTHTYGKKALLLHLSNSPPEEGYHPRSPMAPQEDVPFSVKPHPLAEAMVAWLNDARHAMPHSDDLDRRYALLISEGRLPSLPLRRSSYSMQPQTTPSLDARREQMVARRQQQTNRIQQGSLQFLNSLRGVDEEIRAEFHSIQSASVEGMGQMAQRIETLSQLENRQIADTQHDIAVLNHEVAGLQQGNVELAVRIARVHEEVQEQARDNRRMARILNPILREEREGRELAHLLQQLQQLPNPVRELFPSLRAEMEEQFVINHSRIDAVRRNAGQQLQTLHLEILGFAVNGINHEISQIESRNEEFRQKLTQLSGNIHEAERANVQIQLCANKVEKAIKKRESSNMKGLLTTAAAIGACALTSYGVSYVIEGLSITYTGGPGVQLTLAII